MGSLEEDPRETQVAAKSFVPTNAFLFVERLLDQQLSASRVPGGINGQGSEGLDSCLSSRSTLPVSCSIKLELKGCGILAKAKDK